MEGGEGVSPLPTWNSEYLEVPPHIVVVPCDFELAVLNAVEVIYA
jgi:hypothetical protein